MTNPETIKPTTVLKEPD